MTHDNMENKLFILLVCVLVKFISVSATVPVLIWTTNENSNSIDKPSLLNTLSTEDFHRYLSGETVTDSPKEKPVIIAFIEKTLSVEDFNKKNGNSFPLLEKLTESAKKSFFLSSVQKPLEALRKLPYEQHVFHVDDEVNLNFPSEAGAVLMVNFEDNHRDLKQHDQMIYDIYNKFASQFPHIIAFYTSHRPSWIQSEDTQSVKTRRLFADEENGDEDDVLKGFLWYDTANNQSLVYISESPLVRNSGSDIIGTLTATSITSVTINVTSPSDVTSNVTDTTDVVQLQKLIVDFTRNDTGASGTLEMNFYLSVLNYWQLGDISYTEGSSQIFLQTSTEMYAPLGFSYHCTPTIIFESDSLQLNFTNIQMQPFLQYSTGFKFGDAYDCVHFYTSPILAGLFITLMIAFITSWGLTMIMDIRTNDQYDDPKGKTITINATD